MATKVLEDKSTLLQLQIIPEDKYQVKKAPFAILVSIFAVQPSKDFTDASNNLFRVSSQPGVQVIRQIFPTPLVNPKKHQIGNSYTGLMLLVRVTLKFQIKSEKIMPVILRNARKEFIKRRSMTYTLLEASGMKVCLITGDKLVKVHIQGEKVSEGISVFRGPKGFHSKLIQPFLKLDKVPSRMIHDYAVPSLPVIHKIGIRIDNPSQAVGFPEISKGITLTCGSNNSDVISIIQRLIASFAKKGLKRHIFVIDSRSELNGVVKYYQKNPSQLNELKFQVFRLGTNIHLNICDVIIPLSPSGKKKDLKARAAWKAHYISQILLSSLTTSDYLSQRYSIPLESQIKKTAETSYYFTLKDVKLNVGGGATGDVQVSTQGIDMMYADMMAIDALAGILEQFRSFPEVNYDGFTGHYSNTLTRESTMTIFQFGPQPPLVKRATVAFLLHYLSESMHKGCVVLTHSEEFLSRKTAYSRDRAIIPSCLVEACNKIASENVILLGSQSLQALATNMDSFEEIKNNIYLKMVNIQDREIVRSIHELKFENYTVPYSKKQYYEQQMLGIAEGEGLLFREDVPQNVGFHFKLDSHIIPIDPQPVYIKETQQRGSQTLGLTPIKYEILMGILKLLISQPCRHDDIISFIEGKKQGEISLEQFHPLGLWDHQSQGGITYWTINQKGRDYYSKQYDFLATLPTPLEPNEVEKVHRELKRLESFYDISSSRTDRQETNTKVKTVVGRMLNYLRHLKASSVPWTRLAEYYDLIAIESLEWQDFRNLFDLATSLCNNLYLEIDTIHKQRSEEEIQQTIESSSVKPTTSMTILDDYLPHDDFSILQKISRELELEPYPKTSILDLYFELNTNQRSLFEEIKLYRKKE